MVFVVSPERRDHHEKSKFKEINPNSPYGSHCRCRKFVFLSGLWLQMCTDPASGQHPVCCDRRTMVGIGAGIYRVAHS